MRSVRAALQLHQLPRSPGDGRVPALSDLEWKVVAAAFNDASSHSCGDRRKAGRIKSLLRSIVFGLTGLRPPQPLADPRLEKLRYFLCATTTHGKPPERAARDLADAGFSDAQLEALALLALAEPRGRQ